MARGPVELFADCTHCLLEGGVVELYDPETAASRFGMASRARCRLCAAESRAVVRTTNGAAVAKNLDNVAANACPACERPMDVAAIDERRCASCGANGQLEELHAACTLLTEAEVAARLDAWCKEEEVASREDLLGNHFVEPSISSIVRAIKAGAVIATVADPFALGGGRVTSGVQEGPPVVPPPVHTIEAPPPPSAPPRAIVYPLVSVIAADGELHAAEKEVVDRFLASEGLAPLRPDEFAVHRAEDVARLIPPGKREQVVELMCETACADGIPDASEVRVINAYATAWHIPDDKVKFWLWGYEHASASGARQLWLKIRRFLLSSRWENDE
jgi:hypothetical protein